MNNINNQKIAKVNKNLIKYVEEKVFPEYQKNEEGHRIEHINYVIERSLLFADYFDDIKLDIVYTVAAFHDIAHHIDKDNHEVLSGEIFYKNEDMKEFFTEEERIIIKEAIEDHRASSKTVPRSDYGKIVSSADRTTSISDIMKRMHSYSLRHNKDLTLGGMLERAINHASKKYGNKGYSKTYVEDSEYKMFLEDITKLLQDKELFRQKYLEANNIDIKEYARSFAVKAHDGQVRKGERDKPYIIHPISVAKILEEYGYDDNVIAAAYLHDVVEDTSYTIDDIEREFGKDIATLVGVASEPDKSLSWEERKIHTIKTLKNLTLREKLIPAADKISNLEDMAMMFDKLGTKDFSAFKRGEDSHKWYQTNVYQSLIHNEDETLPIFQRLKRAIDSVFENREDQLLNEVIFKDDRVYYENLKKLHACKIELQKLKELTKLDKPYVIEFTGTPRTGKTTIINRLEEYFKQSNQNVKIIEELTTSRYYKEALRKEWKNLSIGEKNIRIIETIYNILLEEIQKDYDIILIDRGIYDRQVWNLLRYEEGSIEENKYFELRQRYLELSKELINYLVITYTDGITSLRRDYLNSLSLNERRFLNYENIEEYNRSLGLLIDTFKENTQDISIINTTDISTRDTTIELAGTITTHIRKKYINSFAKKYTTK